MRFLKRRPHNKSFVFVCRWRRCHEWVGASAAALAESVNPCAIFFSVGVCGSCIVSVDANQFIPLTSSNTYWVYRIVSFERMLRTLWWLHHWLVIGAGLSTGRNRYPKLSVGRRHNDRVQPPNDSRAFHMNENCGFIFRLVCAAAHYWIFLFGHLFIHLFLVFFASTIFAVAFVCQQLERASGRARAHTHTHLSCALSTSGTNFVRPCARDSKPFFSLYFSRFILCFFFFLFHCFGVWFFYRRNFVFSWVLCVSLN